MIAYSVRHQTHKKAVIADSFFTGITLTSHRCLVVSGCAAGAGLSASAKNTMLLTFANISSVQNTINGLLANESFLVQPFMEEILQGELSLMFFNGQHSHVFINPPPSVTLKF